MPTRLNSIDLRARRNKVVFDVAFLPLVAVLVLSLFGPGCASGVKSKSAPAERAQLYLEAAAAAKSEGDFTGALQYLAEAEKLSPKSPEIFHLKAIVMNSKNEPQLAIESARQAIELRANYSDAMNTLGRLLMEKAQRGQDGAHSAKTLEEAEKWLIQAAGDLLYRDAWKSKTNLGILHYRKGRDPQALQYFTKATEEAPAQACIAHYYIGHLRLKAGSFLEAARSYDRATQKFCAGFADAHLAEGVALERAREYEKARKKFVEITRNFPNTSVADQAVSRLKSIP